MGKFMLGFVSGVASLVGLALLSDKIETKKAMAKIDAEENDDAVKNDEQDEDYCMKQNENTGTVFGPPLPKTKKQQTKLFYDLGLAHEENIDRKVLWEAFIEVFSNPPEGYLRELRDYRFPVSMYWRGKVVALAKSKMATQQDSSDNKKECSDDK